MTDETKPATDEIDRELACEEALQPHIDMAMTAAERSGWTRDEAARALLRVATANYLSIDGGRTMDADAILGDLIETSRD